MGKALFISVLLLILVTCSSVVLAYTTWVTWVWGGFSGSRYSDENVNPIYTTEQWGVTCIVYVSPGLSDVPDLDFKWYDPHGNQVSATNNPPKVIVYYIYVMGLVIGLEGYFYIYEEERELGLYRVEFYASGSLIFTDYFQICTNPSFQVNVNGAIFNITILSNSTITSFNFSKTEKKITFNVTGPDGTLGFCNVAIPNALFDAPPEEWRVLVDNKAVDAKMTPINATYTSLYFKYIHTTHKVTIMKPDMTPPVTVNDYVGAWYVADFTINLTATDYGSGVTENYYRINNGSIQSVSTHGQPRITTESANNTLEYWSVDNAGNEELPHKILTGIKLDKTAPAGSIMINNGDAYTNSTSATLTLTATDAASGVYQVRFSNDGVWDTEPWEAITTTKAWILPSGDGTKTVYYQIKDNAGLISETYSNTIMLDTTKPVANAGQDKKVNVGETVAFDAGASTDDIAIASYEWEFGDGTRGTGRTTTHTYAKAGTYKVTLTVKDAAGNTTTHSITITVVEAFPTWIAVAAIATIAVIIGVVFAMRKRKPKA